MTGILIASGSFYLTRLYKWDVTGDLFPEWQAGDVLWLAEGLKDRQPTHFYKDGERFDKVLDTDAEIRIIKE